MALTRTVSHRTYRIGQIVPSSNTTMETEILAMFHTRETVAPERFTFHSSRMRMKNVTPEELAAMDADSDRCAAELADADVDVLGYACLVAIMSARALVEGLKALNARRVAVVAPYMKPLAKLVADYIEAEGIQVVDLIALEIADNLDVGRRDPMALVEIYKDLVLDDAEALVLSSCVQMPSLAAIPVVERECGLPVVSAAVCTTHQMLSKLGLDTHVPGAGALLSGRY